jgi:hypothetical protein
MKKVFNILIIVILSFSCYSQTYNRKKTYENNDSVYTYLCTEIINLSVSKGTDTITFFDVKHNKFEYYKVLVDIQSISIDNETKNRLLDCIKEPISVEFESYPVYIIGDIYNPSNLQYSKDKILIFYEKNGRHLISEYYTNTYLNVVK